jgi:hypothetical protein
LQVGRNLLKFTALYLGLLALLGMAGALCGYHLCHMYVTMRTGLHLTYTWLPRGIWHLAKSYAHAMWSEVCGISLLARGAYTTAAGVSDSVMT